ncbi:MAG: ATP-binding cassette domain-containing protein [Dehalococcoidales bacterium]|nr:ATP-binding cassette domain-containing protein [Dehalococcoidales bacterium]
MKNLSNIDISDGPALSANGLTKTFGKLKAVDDLTFEMPRGGVIGFVGPNGAGKSTTIRVLLGLIKPTGGNAEVLGHGICTPSAYLKKVGALIESPVFYPSLSGSKNLRALAKLGGFPPEQVPRALEIVGLSSRAGDKVANYSLGMKQRLGIAVALLPNPELLMLDEPTNGLDPAGIVEIRNLLRQIGRSGRTVFISTHLLSEVEAEADRLVMIHNGRLVFAGELADIMEKACEAVYAVPENTADIPLLTKIVSEAGHLFRQEDDAIIITAPKEWSSELNRLATSKGVNLRELRPQCESLEDIFLKMTRGEAGK